MAQLPPNGDHIIQQIDGTVRLFNRYTEQDLITPFNPDDPEEFGPALREIHVHQDLTDEEKSFASFWTGYFYANAANASTPGLTR